MDYHVPGVIDGAGAYAREHGLRLDSRWSVRADWMPGQPGWDGVIVHLIDMEDAMQRVKALGLPMVLLNDSVVGEEWPRLEPDYEECGRLAVAEFQRMGLDRVAAVHMRKFPVERRSFRGVMSGARDLGLEFTSLEDWSRGDSWLKKVDALADEMAKLSEPCGLFVPHAGVVFSLLDVLLERSVRVPDDIAIIVIDKDVQRTAELAPVPLTAVVLDDWQQGYEAASLAHRLITGNEVAPIVRSIPPVGLVRRQSTGGAVSKDPVVAKAMYLIREQLTRIAGVGELAEQVGVSRRTLEMRFRRETGSTVHAALTARRMEEARRLLGHGALPVAQVAEVLGFSSVHYFTSAFKREVGVTPGVYRAERA